MILEVSSELAGGDAEKVLDEVACEANALVGVMVLVVWVSAFNSHLKDLADDASEENCLLLAILGSRTEVRKKFLVEEVLHSSLTVFLLLTSSEGARGVIIGGTPYPETRHIVWNFVSTRRERIEQARQDWRSQRFDPVPGETEFIPLPE